MTSSSFGSVALPDSNTGYLLSGNRLIKTTDGGKNWNSKPISADKLFGLLNFIDKDNGIIIGDTFARTTDGGDTWQISDSPPVSEATCLLMVDKETYFVSNKYGNFYMTKDGGKTWINKTISWCQNSCRVGGISFATNKLGYMVAKYCRIYKTTDGGETWDIQPYQLSGGPDLYAVSYVDSLHCTAVGAEAIVHTSTGGLTDVDKDCNLSNPTAFQLGQNYPNPFNPATTIEYQIPAESKVSISIYNSIGQKIKELVNEIKQAGSYKIDFNGDGLPSGVYFYQLNAGGFNATKRLLLLK